LSKLMCERRGETQGIGSAVLRQVWEQKASIAVKDRFVDPYHFCFECCMHQISEWSEKWAGGEPVALVFAEQSEYQGEVLGLL